MLSLADFRDAKALIGKEVVEKHDGDGLSIRVRKASATWTLRKRLAGTLTTWSLGNIENVGLREARDLRDDANALIKRGVNPADYIRWKAAHGGTLPNWERVVAEEAKAATIRAELDAAAALPPAMTWGQAVEGWMRAKSADHRKGTVEDYRKTFGSPAMRSANWTGRPLPSITENEIKALQDGLADAGKRAQARKHLAAIRLVFKWAANRGDSGISRRSDPAREIDLISKGRKAVPEHVPTVDEVGRSLWQLAKHAMHPSIRLACTLAILTAQRRTTVAGTKITEMQQSDEGLLIWHIPASRMKGGKIHSLPLGPWGSAVVRAAHKIAAGPGSDAGFLFPQTRRRGQDSLGNGHVSAATLTHAFQEAGLGFSPHDARRAMTDYGEQKLGWSKSAVKLILDHSEGMTGDVTDKHYRSHASLPLKAPLMGDWERWVIEQVREFGKGKLPPYLPDDPYALANGEG